MSRLLVYFVVGWLIKLLITAAVLGWALFAGAQEIPQQRGPLGIQPTAERIELGRKLFFDPRLSQDGTIACATCHDPARGWSDGRPVAVGIRNQAGTRNSPTVINATYNDLVFWDGRTIGATTQALLPLVNPIEMGVQTEQQVLQRLRLIPGYIALFAGAFPPSSYDPITRSPITGANLGLAISSFESTVVSFNAPIDRYLAGDDKALSADAQVGYRIFQAAQCSRCHVPPLWTDNQFHNNGSEFAGKVAITDQGRFGVVPANRRTADTVRAFKTPTLREVRRTAPYMHAGQFSDLKRVAIHYNSGGANFQGRVDRSIDPRIKPLGFNDTHLGYLVTFLEEGFSSPEYPLIEAPSLP